MNVISGMSQMVCMDCSLNFGAPTFVHNLVGSTPKAVKSCPRCNGKRVQSSKALKLEINEVVFRYLKENYPHFKYGLEVRGS